jgi:hypothetical protein
MSDSDDDSSIELSNDEVREVVWIKNRGFESALREGMRRHIQFDRNGENYSNRNSSERSDDTDSFNDDDLGLLEEEEEEEEEEGDLSPDWIPGQLAEEQLWQNKENVVDDEMAEFVVSNDEGDTGGDEHEQDEEEVEDEEVLRVEEVEKNANLVMGPVNYEIPLTRSCARERKWKTFKTHSYYKDKAKLMKNVTFDRLIVLGFVIISLFAIIFILTFLLINA